MGLDLGLEVPLPDGMMHTDPGLGIDFPAVVKLCLGDSHSQPYAELGGANLVAEIGTCGWMTAK